MEEVLSFKLWGDYAHFKKFYTTTSPLTFEFPPPATIIGILAAIIGLEKDSYLQYFQNTDDFAIALSILNPVKKVRWSQNLPDIDPKKDRFITTRTQIRIEYLKNPAFEIYFYHKEKSIFQTLLQHLRDHTCIYSVSLGKSELLANFNFTGLHKVKCIQNGESTTLQSVLPYSSLVDDNSILFLENQEIFKVSYPFWMDTNRIVTKREDILFEQNGKQIEAKVKNYWETNNGKRLVFF